MQRSLFWIIACLLVLAIPLPLHAAAQESGGLTVTVTRDGGISATGVGPDGFPLDELRRRAPGIEISATAGGGRKSEATARLLDALTIVLPRLVEGEVRLGQARIEIEGTLRPGFSAEATRGAVRLALGSSQAASIDLAETPPPAALAITWSRHGAVVSGILPEGLPLDEALPLLGDPVEAMVDGGLMNGGLTGGGSGDPAAWREALLRIGRLLPAYSHADVRLGPGRLSADGPLEPGHEAPRLERWLAGTLGEAWEVSLTGSEQPAAEGASRYDPVAGRFQEKVRDRWIPLHAFTPNVTTCRRHGNGILTAEPLIFVSGAATLEEGAAATLDRLAGIARRCLNNGGLTLEIGGHTDSRGDPNENQALSEARAMDVLLELAARGVRAGAMRAVGYGESRAVAGNDTEAGRARNRRITFAWSE